MNDQVIDKLFEVSVNRGFSGDRNKFVEKIQDGEDNFMSLMFREAGKGDLYSGDYDGFYEFLTGKKKEQEDASRPQEQQVQMDRSSVSQPSAEPSASSTAAPRLDSAQDIEAIMAADPTRVQESEPLPDTPAYSIGYDPDSGDPETHMAGQYEIGYIRPDLEEKQTLSTIGPVVQAVSGTLYGDAVAAANRAYVDLREHERFNWEAEGLPEVVRNVMREAKRDARDLFKDFIGWETSDEFLEARKREWAGQAILYQSSQTLRKKIKENPDKFFEVLDAVSKDDTKPVEYEGIPMSKTVVQEYAKWKQSWYIRRIQEEGESNYQEKYLNLLPPELRGDKTFKKVLTDKMYYELGLNTNLDGDSQFNEQPILADAYRSLENAVVNLGETARYVGEWAYSAATLEDEDKSAYRQSVRNELNEAKRKRQESMTEFAVQGISRSIGAGLYENAFRQGLNAVADTVPLIALTAASGGAGGAIAGTAGRYVLSFGLQSMMGGVGTYVEIADSEEWKDNKAGALGYSIASGLADGAFAIAGNAIMRNAAKQAAVEGVAGRSFKEIAGGWLNKKGVSFLQEGLEEFATEVALGYTENVLKDGPNASVGDIFTNAFDAFLIGGVAGTGFDAIGSISAASNAPFDPDNFQLLSAIYDRRKILKEKLEKANRPSEKQRIEKQLEAIEKQEERIHRDRDAFYNKLAYSNRADFDVLMRLNADIMREMANLKKAESKLEKGNYKQELKRLINEKADLINKYSDVDTTLTPAEQAEKLKDQSKLALSNLLNDLDERKRVLNGLSEDASAEAVEIARRDVEQQQEKVDRANAMRQELEAALDQRAKAERDGDNVLYNEANERVKIAEQAYHDFIAIPTMGATNVDGDPAQLSEADLAEADLVDNMSDEEFESRLTEDASDESGGPAVPRVGMSAETRRVVDLSQAAVDEGTEGVTTIDLVSGESFDGVAAEGLTVAEAKAINDSLQSLMKTLPDGTKIKVVVGTGTSNISGKNNWGGFNNSYVDETGATVQVVAVDISQSRSNADVRGKSVPEVIFEEVQHASWKNDFEAMSLNDIGGLISGLEGLSEVPQEVIDRARAKAEDYQRRYDGELIWRGLDEATAKKIIAEEQAIEILSYLAAKESKAGLPKSLLDKIRALFTKAGIKVQDATDEQIVAWLKAVSKMARGEDASIPEKARRKAKESSERADRMSMPDMLNPFKKLPRDEKFEVNYKTKGYDGVTKIVTKEFNGRNHFINWYRKVADSKNIGTEFSLVGGSATNPTFDQINTSMIKRKPSFGTDRFSMAEKSYAGPISKSTSLAYQAIDKAVSNGIITQLAGNKMKRDLAFRTRLAREWEASDSDLSSDAFYPKAQRGLDTVYKVLNGLSEQKNIEFDDSDYRDRYSLPVYKPEKSELEAEVAAAKSRLDGLGFKGNHGFRVELDLIAQRVNDAMGGPPKNEAERVERRKIIAVQTAAKMEELGFIAHRNFDVKAQEDIEIAIDSVLDKYIDAGFDTPNWIQPFTAAMVAITSNGAESDVNVQAAMHIVETVVAHVYSAKETNWDDIAGIVSQEISFNPALRSTLNTSRADNIRMATDKICSLIGDYTQEGNFNLEGFKADLLGVANPDANLEAGEDNFSLNIQKSDAEGGIGHKIGGYFAHIMGVRDVFYQDSHSQRVDAVTDGVTTIYSDSVDRKSLTGLVKALRLAGVDTSNMSVEQLVLEGNKLKDENPVVKKAICRLKDQRSYRRNSVGNANTVIEYKMHMAEVEAMKEAGYEMDSATLQQMKYEQSRQMLNGSYSSLSDGFNKANLAATETGSYILKQPVEPNAEGIVGELIPDGANPDRFSMPLQAGFVSNETPQNGEAIDSPLWRSHENYGRGKVMTGVKFGDEATLSAIRDFDPEVPMSQLTSSAQSQDYVTKDPIDGIEVTYDPHTSKYPVDARGNAIKSADTLFEMNGKMYVDGNIEYATYMENVGEGITDMKLPQAGPVYDAGVDAFVALREHTGHPSETRAQSVDRFSMLPDQTKDKMMNDPEVKKKVNQVNHDRFSRRIRGTAGRAASKYKGASDAIRNNPENYIEPQKLKALGDKVKHMTDAELASEMTSTALESLKNNQDSFGVLAGAELIQRAAKIGDDAAIARYVEDLAKMGTSAGRILRQLRELKGFLPKSMFAVINSAVEKAGNRLSDEQRDRLQSMCDEMAKLQKEYDQLRRRAITNGDVDGKLKETEKKLLDLERDLNTFTNNVVERGWGEIGGTLVQGNLLTTVSQLKNIGWNIFQLVTRTPVNLFAIPVERMMNMLGKEFKKNSKYDNFLSWKATWEGLKGGFDGLIEAGKQVLTGQDQQVTEWRMARGFQPFRAWVSLFSNDLPLTQEGKASRSQQIKKVVEGTLGIPAEVMFRLLTLGDLPFRRFVERKELYKMGKKAGLKGEALSRFVKYPPKDAEAFAQEEGLKLTAQNETTVSKAANDAINAAEEGIGKFFTDVFGDRYVNPQQVIKFISKLVVPYRSTPANILHETLTFISPYYAMARIVKNYRDKNSRELGQNFGKMMVGGIATQTALMLVREGLISSAFDFEEDEERNLSNTMFPEMSINITGLKRFMNGEDPSLQEGDEFRRYDTVGIIGTIFGSISHGADRAELKRRNYEDMPLPTKLIQDHFGVQAFSGMSYMLDQSFLQGISGLLNLMVSDYTEASFERFARSTMRAATSIPLPNSLTGVVKANTEHMRDLRVTKDMPLTERLATAFMYEVKRKTFGLGDVPIRVDWKGDDIKYTPEGSDEYMYNIFDMTKARVSESAPVQNELYRLWFETETVPDVVGTPSYASTSSVSVPDIRSKKMVRAVKDVERANGREYTFLKDDDFLATTVRLNTEQINRMMKISGKERYQKVEQLMATRDYINASDYERVEMLNDLNKDYAKALQLVSLGYRRRAQELMPHSIELLNIMEEIYLKQSGEE